MNKSKKMFSVAIKDKQEIAFLSKHGTFSN